VLAQLDVTMSHPWKNPQNASPLWNKAVLVKASSGREATDILYWQGKFSAIQPRIDTGILMNGLHLLAAITAELAKGRSCGCRRDRQKFITSPFDPIGT